MSLVSEVNLILRHFCLRHFLSECWLGAVEMKPGDCFMNGNMPVSITADSKSPARTCNHDRLQHSFVLDHLRTNNWRSGDWNLWAGRNDITLQAKIRAPSWKWILHGCILLITDISFQCGGVGMENFLLEETSCQKLECACFYHDRHEDSCMSRESRILPQEAGEWYSRFWREHDRSPQCNFTGMEMVYIARSVATQKSIDLPSWWSYAPSGQQYAPTLLLNSLSR